MEEAEGKVSVWVCQEEKLVSGLSRRTTCADVVLVLLEDQNRHLEEEEEEGEEGSPAGRGMLSGPPHCYCIVEKWRGFERILPNKTRILRLWGAWGEEQRNVAFVLVNMEASLPNSGPRSAEARVVLSKESPCILRGAGKPGATLTQDKQRRVVKKAFRKLAKINKKRKESLPKDASPVEKMETLVHLVLSQDHTMRQQVQRIQELDQEIERHEATVHMERLQRHGANYLQDTYLAAGGSQEEGSGGALQPGEDLARYEEYAKRCEEVLQLQGQLEAQERLIEAVAAEIQEELNHRWMERRNQELCSAKEASEGQGAPGEPGGCCEGQLLMEKERVKTQLSTSLYIGLRLNTDMEATRGDLDYSQQVWEEMEGELRGLMETMGAREAGEGEGVPPDTRTPGDSSEVWAEQVPGLCKDTAGNDDDSDTGLSSMHSQDSDSIPTVCESLV